MNRVITKLNDKRVTLENAVAAPAVPTTVADGGDISGWAQGDAWPEFFELQLFASGAATLSGAELYGWDAVDSRWCQLADLNGGASISISSTKEWRRPFTLAAKYTRLAVAGTMSANNLTAKAVPLEALE